MAARKGRASAATVKVLVVTVVNALGVIIDRSGKVIRGLRDSETGQRMHPRDVIKVTPQSEAPPQSPLEEIRRSPHWSSIEKLTDSR
jgi:hypothetical protein